MQMIEANITERGLLPLPAAALVVDLRGVSDDRVVEWLSIEVADLASEMQTHDVHHWRYLTELLSFTRIEPIADTNSQTATEEEDEEEEQGPLGRVPPQRSQNSLFPEEEQNPLNTHAITFNPVQQKIDEMVQEIRRIRNNRIAAVKDLNIAGIPGRSYDDATVRVIFLTDAGRSESLTSAALYAERLKEHYRKLEHQTHQPLISTTVLCLGHSGEVGPPEKLIKGLMRNNSWKHIDSLILSEDYREDAAWIAGTMQAYVAELLLYVLLIIPPLSATPATDPTAQNGSQGVSKDRQVSLPPNTYLLGAAALEYSSRWGRRWLNFSLAKEVAEILRQKPADENKEKARIKGTADSWFKDWRSRVQGTIPDHLPGEIPALEGIHHAQQAADPAQKVFKVSDFSPNLRKSTIRDLKEYQTKLVQTYVASTSDPDLQTAVLQSTPQVMQALQEREDKSLAERKVTDLGALQVEAEQLLSHPKFFSSATGAAPRARTQLWAVGAAISRFQQEHQNNPLNPLATRDEVRHRQEELEQSGNKMIDNLKKHLENWPLFGCALHLKRFMAILTTLLILFLSMLTVLVGFGWLHHFIVLGASSALPFADAELLGAPTLEVVDWGLVLLLMAIEVIILGPMLTNKRRRPLEIEIIFWSALVVFALYGLLVNFSIDSLKNLLDDATSIQYLAWLSFVPQWSFIAFIVALFILVAEVAYFFGWLNYLQRERKRIVKELRTQHEKDIQDITNFIADDVTLEILRRAELTDGNGGLGGYYFRIAQLCDLLEKVAGKTSQQQQLAANRLLLSQNEAQQGAGIATNGRAWLNLHIREEKLEMDALTDGYKGLKQKLVAANEELRELAEFLLRLEGVEKPGEIAEQLEEKSTKASEEQRRLQLFMTTLVAIAMRFAVDPLASNIDSITQQDQSTEEYAREQIPALNTLIQTLKSRVSQTTLEAPLRPEHYQQTAPDTLHNDIAANALALWGQLFWQHKQQKLDQALAENGVLAQLARLQQRDYDPHAIMRHLISRTVLLGRSPTGPKQKRSGNVYLLLSPSQQSYRFRQELKGLKLPPIIEFPDIERILLLGIQRYIADPMLLPEPQVEPDPVAANGQQPEPDDATVVDSTNNANVVDSTVQDAVVPPPANGAHADQQVNGSSPTATVDEEDKDDVTSMH